MSVDDTALFDRLIQGRGGEVEVTPEEMHYLNGLTDWDFEALVKAAVLSRGLEWFPPAEGETTRVRVVWPTRSSS
jgi:hypothetical protein